MTTDDLEKDSSGKIVTRPVKGWSVAPVADMFVFLQLRYAESPEELQGPGRVLQFGLLPAQALELAEMLTRQARAILDAPPPPAPHN
ncbi:MAG TPA: hypothetical protein VK779_07610 [Rhizomicrobium sp.]|jgi:hypothetical protein|nr:hypothetical protein [Rhizomicrobium sp.]